MPQELSLLPLDLHVVRLADILRRPQLVGSRNYSQEIHKQIALFLAIQEPTQVVRGRATIEVFLHSMELETVTQTLQQLFQGPRSKAAPLLLRGALKVAVIKTGTWHRVAN
jgi:hypothetical protein